MLALRLFGVIVFECDSPSDQLTVSGRLSLLIDYSVILTTFFPVVWSAPARAMSQMSTVEHRCSKARLFLTKYSGFQQLSFHSNIRSRFTAKSSFTTTLRHRIGVRTCVFRSGLLFRCLPTHHTAVVRAH